jgi:phosphotriesterase-related protein
MAHLITTQGPLAADQLGCILPHEHLFVDFRLPDDPDQGAADLSEVVAVVGPEVAAARALGVTAQVDATPVGLGRRVDVLVEVSRTTGMPIVAPTGIYREPYIPAWAHEATESNLTRWMLEELREGIEGTGVRAGWIKLSAGDDGLSETEIKVLRASAVAGSAVNAVIGSHTQRGRVVLQQMDILEAAGHSIERFIWIHPQLEPDRRLHFEVASRGAWIEYDAIGDMPDDYFVDRIGEALAAGLGDRLLLSQDRGWFDPAVPGGGTPRPFTYLSERFLPRLRAEGIDNSTVRLLTEKNPFLAFAR